MQVLHQDARQYGCPMYTWLSRIIESTVNETNIDEGNGQRNIAPNKCMHAHVRKIV